MKNSRICLSLVSAVTFLVTVAHAADTSPVITSIEVRDDQTILTWINGRPTYQVQMLRLGPDQSWSNVGTPTSGNSVTLPFAGTQAFFRVVSDFTARYQVVFNSTWSQSTHPTNWPASAHWSGLVGGTHSAAVHFWREGETASEGIRLMAERGQKATLLTEVAAAITRGTAHQELSGAGIGTSPGSVTVGMVHPMSRDYPLVTLVSMVAPSPDWFAGVDSLSMINDGHWVGKLEVPVYGYDAGTDAGPNYVSADQVTVPRGVVSRFDGFPAVQDGLILPFGTFTFTRLD